MGKIFETIEVPVPAGTPVYVIEGCACYTQMYADRCRIKNGNRTGNATAIAVFPRTNPKRGFKCLKLYVRPFDPIEHLTKWGKRVFATQEEAIKVIKKKEKENEV